jgi:hypothetical protein
MIENLKHVIPEYMDEGKMWCIIHNCIITIKNKNQKTPSNSLRIACLRQSRKMNCKNFQQLIHYLDPIFKTGFFLYDM